MPGRLTWVGTVKVRCGPQHGNAVEIQNAADALIQSLQTEYASDGLNFTVTFQQAKNITQSLADLRFALFFGVLLVATIVYVIGVPGT